MTKTPETIYLIPGETWDSREGLCWCDDPAPESGMDPADAVEYVRKDTVNALQVDRDKLATMVKVFRGCIETRALPEPGSPCEKFIFDLVGERDDETP